MGKADEHHHAEGDGGRSHQDIVAKISGSEFENALEGNLEDKGSSEPGQGECTIPSRRGGGKLARFLVHGLANFAKERLGTALFQPFGRMQADPRDIPLAKERSWCFVTQPHANLRLRL